MQIWIFQEKVRQVDLRILTFSFTGGAVIDKNPNLSEDIEITRELCMGQKKGG